MRKKIKIDSELNALIKNNPILRDIVNQQMEKQRNIISQTISETNDVFCKELKTMYDFFIDDFYRYKTRSYDRHGEGVGTGTGWVLYEAGQFKANNKKSYGRQTLSWDFYYDSDMSGIDYEFDSADRVLNMVLHGTRFMLPTKIDDWMDSLMIWNMPSSYRMECGIQINHIQDIYELYNKIDKNFESIATKIFDSIWNKKFK